MDDRTVWHEEVYFQKQDIVYRYCNSYCYIFVILNSTQVRNLILRNEPTKSFVINKRHTGVVESVARDFDFDDGNNLPGTAPRGFRFSGRRTHGAFSVLQAAKS